MLDTPQLCWSRDCTVLQLYSIWLSLFILSNSMGRDRKQFSSGLLWIHVQKTFLFREGVSHKLSLGLHFKKFSSLLWSRIWCVRLLSRGLFVVPFSLHSGYVLYIVYDVQHCCLRYGIALFFAGLAQRHAWEQLQWARLPNVCHGELHKERRRDAQCPDPVLQQVTHRQRGVVSRQAPLVQLVVCKNEETDAFETDFAFLIYVWYDVFLSVNYILQFFSFHLVQETSSRHYHRADRDYCRCLCTYRSVDAPLLCFCLRFSMYLFIRKAY